MTDKVEASFAAAGSTPAFRVAGGSFNIFLTGTFTGLSARLQRRPAVSAAGAWAPCTSLGSVVTFTAECTETIDEIESDMDYRVIVDSIASGTVNVRLSQ